MLEQPEMTIFVQKMITIPGYSMMIGKYNHLLLFLTEFHIAIKNENLFFFID